MGDPAQTSGCIEVPAKLPWRQHRTASWCRGCRHRRGLVLLPFTEMRGGRAGRATPEGRPSVQRFSSCSRRIKGFIVVSVSSCRSSLQGEFSDGSRCLGFGCEGYHENNLADNPVSGGSCRATIHRTPAVRVTQGNATSRRGTSHDALKNKGQGPQS